MSGIVRLDPASVALEPQVAEGPALTRAPSLFEPGLGLIERTWHQDDRVRKFYVIRERAS